MVVLLLLKPPRTLRALGGRSAAGSSHSRHFAAAQQLGRFWSEADFNPGRSQNWIYEYTR
jgi:hypothetical protein